MEKQCKKCKESKERENNFYFYEKGNSWDSTCVACRRIEKINWRENNREHKRVYNRIWKSKNKSKVSFYQTKYNRKIRKEVIKHYGNSCACCGEKAYEFLAIDHINGGGNKHRKETGQRALARWIKSKGFPEGFQILCFNCNMAKHNYPICPHKLKDSS